MSNLRLVRLLAADSRLSPLRNQIIGPPKAIFRTKWSTSRCCYSCGRSALRRTPWDTNIFRTWLTGLDTFVASFP